MQIRLTLQAEKTCRTFLRTIYAVQVMIGID